MFSPPSSARSRTEAGVSAEGCARLVDELTTEGRVFISDENAAALPANAEAMLVPPAAFHDLLAFADLVVGDVATTTVESATLGTPTVRISPFADVDSEPMGKFRALERAGLVRSFGTDREDVGIAAAGALWQDPAAGRRWADRRRRLLDATIDVTDYVLGRLLDDVDLERQPTAPTSTEPPGSRADSDEGAGDRTESDDRTPTPPPNP